MLNIAVLVSGGGTNLQALLDAQARGEIRGGRISLVVSSKPNAYALTRAEGAKVKAITVERRAYDTKEAYSDALIETLQAHDIGLVVLAGFMIVLSERFCSAFSHRIINVHPALIPSFCGDGFYGLHVHEAALKYGVKVTGATVHFVNSVTDGGEIILQKAVEIRPDDTPETLQRRVMEQAEWVILPQAVSLFCEGRLRINGRTVQIVDRKE